MILTLTPNPSLDKTVSLPGALERGGVQRAESTHLEPGGKGVNITRALQRWGAPTLALFPGNDDDPFTELVRAQKLPHHAVHIQGKVRENLTLSEPDGTTTKINELGPRLSAQERTALLTHTVQILKSYPPEVAREMWLVLAGSVPAGLPHSFYADLMAELRAELGGTAPHFALDTSGPALQFGVDAAPSLIKPNAEELSQLGPGDESYSARVLEADPQLAARLAVNLLKRGVGAVLATLGAAGAILVSAQGVWYATPSPIQPKSTVGAGDASLAGYLFALGEGKEPAEALRWSVAAGAAAAALPGTQMPQLEELDLDNVSVTELDLSDAGTARVASGLGVRRPVASSSVAPPP